MKKVLVIYFSQSGQLYKAITATLRDLSFDNEISMTTEQLKPRNPFPFPWTYMQFFDAFPETVQGIPCELEPYSFSQEINYDLVIIAYQPWFLSPSRPIESFLQSKDAAKLLKGKPVITLLACRNMWLNAQEKMKAHLHRIGANLVGNITYVDRSSNLVSLVTVLAFALGGVRDRFLGIFPKYGVPDEELEKSGWKFGTAILKKLKSGNFEGLQNELVELGAINIKPNLMIMEGRGKVLFPLYARFIMKKGKVSSRERRTRVRIFGIALPTAIILFSPIIIIVSRLMPLLFRSKMKQERAYYSGISLR